MREELETGRDVFGARVGRLGYEELMKLALEVLEGAARHVGSRGAQSKGVHLASVEATTTTTTITTAPTAETTTRLYTHDSDRIPGYCCCRRCDVVSSET